MDNRVKKIIDLIENTVDEVSRETLQSYREKRLKEPLDKRTPTKTKGIQRSYTKMMYKINKDDKGTFGDNKGYGQGRYMGDSVEEGILNRIADKVMGAAPRIPKYKIGQEVSYETPEDQHSWKDRGRGRGKITDYKNGHYIVNGNPVNHFDIKKVHESVDEGDRSEFSAQRAYNKRVNNESMVARVQGGRKMVSAEAALRHAREIAHKRSPGSKPTMSDIAAAHRKLSSGVKESDELEEGFSSDLGRHINESFVVKDPSGKTVAVKYSENEAKKAAEELTKKTGQKHSVKFERTAMVRTVKEDTDGKDTVTLEIPALIRALEWAREDAEDDVEIHKFVEKLINHEGTVDMNFFSEGVVPSAVRKIDKNGRPYPAHQVQVGTNESETLKVGETV